MLTQLKNDERGILIKNGKFKKYLIPHHQFYFPFGDCKVEIFNTNDAFQIDPIYWQDLLKEPKVMEDIEVIEVLDHEIVLHLENNHFVEILKPGRYIFWKVVKKHTFIRIDLTNPEVDNRISLAILQRKELEDFCFSQKVDIFEKGLLFYNNSFQKILEPGKYYFWVSPVEVKIEKIEMQPQVIEIQGQNVLIQDHKLVIDFDCHYKVSDPYLFFMQLYGQKNMIESFLQVALQNSIGFLKLEDVLKQKQDINHLILKQLKEKEKDWGVVFLFAGIKEIKIK